MEFKEEWIEKEQKTTAGTGLFKGIGLFNVKTQSTSPFPPGSWSSPSKAQGGAGVLSTRVILAEKTFLLHIRAEKAASGHEQVKKHPDSTSSTLPFSKETGAVLAPPSGNFSCKLVSFPGTKVLKCKASPRRQD